MHSSRGMRFWAALAAALSIPTGRAVATSGGRPGTKVRRSPFDAVFNTKTSWPGQTPEQCAARKEAAEAKRERKGLKLERDTNRAYMGNHIHRVHQGWKRLDPFYIAH